MLVTQGECYSVTAVWTNGSTTIGGVAISDSLSVSPNYRAKRLVRTQESAYCPALDRYVSKYTYDNNTKVAYGYQTTIYNDPELIAMRLDEIIDGNVIAEVINQLSSANIVIYDNDENETMLEMYDSDEMFLLDFTKVN